MTPGTEGFDQPLDLVRSEPLGKEPDRQDQLEEAAGNQCKHPYAMSHADQVEHGQHASHQEDRIADEAEHG